MDKKRDEKNYPFHMRGDVRTRNKNIDLGHKLCKRCEGTGNELYSMYRACPLCRGTGKGVESGSE